MKFLPSVRKTPLLPCLLAAPLLLAAAIIVPSPVYGQADGKIPPPEEVELRDRNGLPLTRDGVIIKATFYPGMRKEKSVPIIMLHGYKGKRSEFAQLALFLQKDHGHAVLVPDLRGHGDSTEVVGASKSLEADRLGPNDFEKMVSQDVEACKKFLIEKNNAGQLNIEKLCIIGSEMGAVVAMNWAVLDWSWPVLATGKQGQDVKALVLISPLFNVEKGRLNMGTAINSPLQKNFSVSILYGAKGKSSYARDAKRLQSSLARWHTGDEQSLFIDELKTSLQGTKLLEEPSLPVPQMIAAFIELKLVNKDHPWRERGGPLSQ